MHRLADILGCHGPAYVQRFSDRMPAVHKQVLRDLVRCRTPEAGGQLWLCPKCAKQHYAYRSCGNRHCPTCGADDARLWLDRQLSLRLPIDYFLCTCTVPEPLRKTIRSNPKIALNILFDSASSSILDLCRNPKWFGATPGITAVLHTWSRALVYHPHIHFLVTGGGLDKAGHWITPPSGFLVPEHAVSRLFRARFRDVLRKAMPQAFASIPHNVWSIDWVVDITNVGSGTNALRYLARYIYRVALTDSSILHFDPGAPPDKATVTFRYRNSDTGKSHKITLPAFDFIHRFLQHVLPKGFVKVRYYGLHHPQHRKALLLARSALYLKLGLPIPPSPAQSVKPPLLCTACRSILIPGPIFRPGEIPPHTGPPGKTS